MPAPLDIRDQLLQAAGEFLQLCRQSATREQLLNGVGGLKGLNHVNELFNLLPASERQGFKLKP